MGFLSHRVKKGLAVGSLSAVFLMLPLGITASAAERDHDRGNRVFLYHPYAGWGDWGWGLGWGGGWGSWWPYPGYPYWYHGPDTGKIKLEQVDHKDRVYLDGAFAGTAGEVGTMKLKPGRYDVEVRHNGKDVLNDHVYVIAGKTIKLDVGDKS